MCHGLLFPGHHAQPSGPQRPCHGGAVACVAVRGVGVEAVAEVQETVAEPPKWGGPIGELVVR